MVLKIGSCAIHPGTLVGLTARLLAVTACLCAVRARAGDALENGGFEGDAPARGWSVHVYGAKPSIDADRQVVHGGAQSLRIEAREPSDTALGQNVLLPPGKLFRLRGWVKTRELAAPPGVRVTGTFQVQDHDGSPRVSGKGRAGTNDWSEEQVLFRVPPDGKVRVAVFFAGFGKGTGTAWFDDVRLEQVEEGEADRVRITARPLGGSPVSPFQCGQFVELLADLVPGMQAERLDDDSFEGPVPYHFKFRPEVDPRDRTWYPSGAVHKAEWTLDPEAPWNGKVSMRIRAPGPEACTAGISQDGIWFSAGQPLRLRVYLRGDAPGGGKPAVFARLGGGGRALAVAPLGEAGGSWALHQARLVPAEGSRDATLTIELRGPGTVWIDRVSLVPEDAAPGGWRPDVVAALRDLRPGIVRFGGSTLEGYEWESGVGDIGRRVPFENTYWGGRDPNTVGIEEFIELCRLMGAEPLICVRWTGKKPQDAAAEVEYVNGPADSPGGRRRAANGHVEPYGVKYWQIGNEVGGKEYEESVAAFARAMKAADPSIRLLSSFPSETTLLNGAAFLDYLCPHHYGCAALEAMESDLLGLADLVKQHGGGRPIRVAITEWNTTAGDWGHARWSLLTLENALACSRYHNLMQRHSDIVEIAIRSNLTNSFCSGIIQTRGPALVLAPTYHAQRLYSRAGGDRPLAVETLLPPAADEVDLSATLSPDGRTLRIYAVNEGAGAARRRISLEGLGRPARRARSFVVADREEPPQRSAANWFDDPQRVRPTEGEVDLPGGSFDRVFPPLSLTLLEVSLEH